MKKIALILLLFVGSISWSQQFIVTEMPGREKPVPKIDPAKKSELLEKKDDVVVLEEKTEEGSVEEFKELLNYTPKAFVENLKSKPKTRMLGGSLKSINDLEVRYAYQEQMKLNAEEVKWLEDEINQLAIAYFMEGKPLLIRKTGGYEGCTGQRVTTETRDGKMVKIMYFCYTCSGASKYEDRFLEIFNQRTEKLLAVKK